MLKIIGIILTIVFLLLAFLLGTICYLYKFKTKHFEYGTNIIYENEPLDKLMNYLFE